MGPCTISETKSTKYFRFSGNLDTAAQTWLISFQFKISFYDSGEINKKMDLSWRIWPQSLQKKNTKSF